MSLCLVVPAEASALTVYVDPASKGGRCNDAYSVSRAATRATPWCTLRQALNHAPPGTSLRLRAGTHKAVEPTDVTRKPSRLTLSSVAGERAVVASIYLKRCRHLTFRGLTIRYVRIEGCPGSAFLDNDVTSEGLWAFYSTDLRYVGNRLHDTDNGIVLRRVKRVLLRDNHFTRIPRPTLKGDGGDGLQFGNSSQVTVRGNTFVDFPVHPHTDSIEIYGSNPGVTLDGNAFHRVRGPIDVGEPGVVGPFSNPGWRIVNNEFTNTREWALELVNVPGARIVNNTSWRTGHGFRLHGDATRGVVLANNLSDFMAADAPGMVGRSFNNIIGQIVGAYATGPGDSVDLDPTFVNIPKERFGLARGSLGIDIASPAVAPKRDRLGHARVGPPDVGAYEYVGG